ncbi:MAG: gliding motility lipoprotein GldH [Bacteroidales bacterium]|nr:gliding motility lipoprotein GldH [Bacteroidales bacterium]MCF6341785.1 gliding motility lipoprotein GldH [Bacteroidales bacterium]
MKTKFFLFPVLFLLYSCGQPVVFKEHKKFEDVSWNRFDILFFEVPVQAGDYLDFYLALRHHTNFPYDYLDANITFYMPGGGMRTAEYHFKLKQKNGEWKAKGMGELWDIELPVSDSLHFKKAGICKVRVENKMTKTETPGLVEVGLIVRGNQ